MDHLTAYQKVQLARHPQRPYFLDYVEHLCPDFVEVSDGATVVDLREATRAARLFPWTCQRQPEAPVRRDWASMRPGWSSVVRSRVHDAAPDVSPTVGGQRASGGVPSNVRVLINHMVSPGGWSISVFRE